MPLAQPTARNLKRVIFEQILVLARERGIVGVTQEMINSAQETPLGHGQQLQCLHQILQTMLPVLHSQETIIHAELPRVFQAVENRMVNVELYAEQDHKILVRHDQACGLFFQRSRELKNSS